jgi:hypothetical protein
MRTTPRTEADAVKASRRTLLPKGWTEGKIIEASDAPAKSGAEMTTLVVGVPDADGVERQLRDYLTDTPLCAARLRHVCEAVGALAQFEAGEISAADFPGHTVRIKIGVEKKRGYPDRNVIEDYGTASASGVVSLRRTGS